MQKGGKNQLGAELAAGMYTKAFHRSCTGPVARWFPRKRLFRLTLPHFFIIKMLLEFLRGGFVIQMPALQSMAGTRGQILNILCQPARAGVFAPQSRELG